MANNKPQIRFQGHQEEWEEKTLGEMGKTFNGLSGKTKEDFGHGEAKFITYMNVFSNPIASPKGVDNVEIDKTQNEVKRGDILFTTSSETPEEVGMSSVWLEDTPNTYLNSFCFGFRPDTKIDPFFSAYLMRSPKIRKDFYFLAQGISRFNISKQKAMDIKTTIPKEKEQEKIGEFFRSLDELIEAKEQELEKLRQIKLALLDGMFPSDEPDKLNRGGYNTLVNNILEMSDQLYISTSELNVPVIRFRGFTEPWKKVSLSENATFSKGRGYSKADIKKTGTPILLYGSLYTNYNTSIEYVASYADKKDGSIFSIGNEVVVPTSGETAEDIARASAIYAKGIILGGDLNIIYPNEDIDPTFLALDITYGRNHKLLVKKAQGVSVVHLHNTDIQELDLVMPDKNEQKKIGDFFSEQDENIRSAQLQINKLRNIKQACMQKMFA